eukprot:m.89079 g.89079  ORF g.89079 m.89079 type:complete len:119 (+) comp36593_c0_seq1:159-515(+)
MSRCRGEKKQHTRRPLADFTNAQSSTKNYLLRTGQGASLKRVLSVNEKKRLKLSSPMATSSPCQVERPLKNLFRLSHQLRQRPTILVLPRENGSPLFFLHLLLLSKAMRYSERLLCLR